MLRALRNHGPEYLMEACGLGLFMLSAGFFAVILESPGSPVRGALPEAFARRALMGLAMGLTAILLIYYPWGQQSGAHYNPAVTLAFLRLGRIKPVDAAFYILAQFAGGCLGVVAAGAMLGGPFAMPPVSSVSTHPPDRGAPVAFAAELLISCLLMLMVLTTGARPRWSRRTGLLAGMLIAVFITLEAPLSGMSMNPARSFASAWAAKLWAAWWVYFLAPPLGMLLAVELYRRLGRPGSGGCAKLNHHTTRRCIFCGFPGAFGRNVAAPAASNSAIECAAHRAPTRAECGAGARGD